jgi:hypothetical protein
MDDAGLEAERAVLADELAQRGDPHGELIALQLALEALPASASPVKRRSIERRIAAVMDTHHDAIFGVLAPHVNRSSRPDLFSQALEIMQWRAGFVDAVFLQRRLEPIDLPDIIRGVRAMPIAKFVRAIHLGIGNQIEAVAELARDPPASLRALYINEWRRHIARLQNVKLDTFTDELVALLATLEVVELTGIRYQRFASPTLRELELYTASSAVQSNVIFDAELPELRRLKLQSMWLDDAILERYPRLEHLHASLYEIREDWLAPLLRSDRFAQLRELVLGYACGDDQIAVLARHADRLGNLTRLELVGQGFTAEGRALAQARLPAFTKLATKP